MNSSTTTLGAASFWWDDAGDSRLPEEARRPGEIHGVVIGGGLAGLAIAPMLRRGVAVLTVRLGRRHANRFLHDNELVEPRGIEPLTSCMPCKRSPG